MQGQIYKIHSDFYYVQNENKVFECKIREVLKKQREKIVVGDFVEFENGVIYSVLPKKNYIPRPSVANVDQIVVVSALKHPDVDFHQLNRYVSLAKYYKI
ncbi:MAG: GTPase RsgA, partial [Muribaculaceae bacterium]|nr:GTPase RsgA [Muribaculaceae bacterium]